MLAHGRCRRALLELRGHTAGTAMAAAARLRSRLAPMRVSVSSRRCIGSMADVAVGHNASSNRERPHLRATIGINVDDLCTDLDVSCASTVNVAKVGGETPEFNTALASELNEITDHRAREGRKRFYFLSSPAYRQIST